MNTQLIFASIVIAVILQRLFELRISRRNAGFILAQGGKEYSDNLLGMVKVLQVCWWIAMIAEVYCLDRPFIPILAAIALTATLGGQILRYLSMKALQWRWTLPVMLIPAKPVVNTGIYRYLRHPNWLGVILEIAFLPLIHGAFLTAVVFSIANGILISKRIKLEEKVLIENSNYSSAFVNVPAFVPKLTFDFNS